MTSCARAFKDHVTSLCNLKRPGVGLGPDAGRGYGATIRRYHPDDGVTTRRYHPDAVKLWVAAAAGLWTWAEPEQETKSRCMLNLGTFTLLTNQTATVKAVVRVGSYTTRCSLKVAANPCMLLGPCWI